MTAVKVIHRCATGWKLYDEWTRATDEFEKHGTVRLQVSSRTARAHYKMHLKSCRECTPENNEA